MSTISNKAILGVRKPKPRYPVIKEIQKRFSPRFFASEEIPKDDLNAIFEAARWAPSGHNHQPWYFYYANKGTPSYTKLFKTLNDYNQSWAKTAPLLVLACFITKNKDGKNPFAPYDLGAAVISLILQAQSLGYYARQMGLFDKKNVKSLFSLEKNIEPFVIIAVGNIGDYTKAPKHIIDLELDPRPRKEDFAHEL